MNKPVKKNETIEGLVCLAELQIKLDNCEGALRTLAIIKETLQIEETA
jgi:hypothetical protein